MPGSFRLDASWAVLQRLMTGGLAYKRLWNGGFTYKRLWKGGFAYKRLWKGGFALKVMKGRLRLNNTISARNAKEIRPNKAFERGCSRT